MIEFLTIFLHLMSGFQPVEVTVAPEVAVVEFVLDGTSVAVLKAPPWRTDVDFGDLGYHSLEAIAFASNGSELERISQQINLPRSPVEARIVFEHYDGNSPTKARVVWNAVTDIKPGRIDMRLDGSMIESDVLGSFALPKFINDGHHMIIADVFFPGGISTTAEAVIGGRFGSEVRSELTAIPIEFDGEVTQQMASDRIRVNKTPTKVAALEKLGARIAVVQDPGSHAVLRRVAGMLDGRNLRGFPRDLLVSEQNIKTKMDLVSLVHPSANPTTARGGDRVVFPVIGPLSLQSQSLAWVVSHARVENLATTPLRCADAVAAAAIRVAATARPRAVILILDNVDRDDSQFAAAEVRAYLESIRVPLFVWQTGVMREPGPWGPTEHISSSKKIRQAADRLQSELKKQWIVWIDGQMAPNEVTVIKPVIAVP